MYLYSSTLVFHSALHQLIKESCTSTRRVEWSGVEAFSFALASRRPPARFAPTRLAVRTRTRTRTRFGSMPLKSLVVRPPGAFPLGTRAPVRSSNVASIDYRKLHFRRQRRQQQRHNKTMSAALAVESEASRVSICFEWSAAARQIEFH